MSFFTAEQTMFFVDDDAALREANVQTLDLASLAVEAFPDAASVLPRIDAGFPALSSPTSACPGWTGSNCAPRSTQIDPGILVILVTGHADVAMAVRGAPRRRLRLPRQALASTTSSESRAARSRIAR